jgi:3D (Asp-Asp-Asp) domain-containing protein
MQEQVQLASIARRLRMYVSLRSSTQWLILTLLLGAFSAGAGEITATVTAYCSCPKCCNRWSGGPTASGKLPREGVTVAAPRRLKFGTRIYIEGVGERLVQDRLAKRYDNRFDVYFNDHDVATRFGKRQLKVKVIDS